jgi:hypothetical protein
MLPPIILDSAIKDMRNLDSEMNFLYKDVYDVLQTPFKYRAWFFNTGQARDRIFLKEAPNLLLLRFAKPFIIK